ncbi:MAG: hypothetical protein Q8K26_00145 [Candidatus Gracilibacteria bacterium]|nr:hypothetical protein [Candidatus Gracilibacteria bacterium]
MKTPYLRIIPAILILLATFSPLVHADFFEDAVLGTAAEDSLIEQISLTHYTFRSPAENARFANTTRFVTEIKNETKRRSQDGTISLYRRYDIIHDLDALVHSMNQYFTFQKHYEQTRRAVYRDAALEYLNESRSDYERLRGTLGRSGE